MLEFILPIVFVSLIVIWKREFFQKKENPSDDFLDEIAERRMLRANEKTIQASQKRFSDELNDFNPKSWLSKYRQTSFLYLFKMGLFYSAIGLVCAFAVYGVQLTFFGYEEPVVPVSIILGITAGPIEETLFFGIPFAITGNHFVMLGTGILWSAGHLLNAQTLGIDGAFSYANFAFTLSHIFFSLRTWKSGKGMFAIFFHSVWNIGAVSLSMGLGEMPLQIIDMTDGGIVDTSMLILSAVLLVITIPLYRWRLKREARKELE